jgi:hypothetical protein
LWRAIVAAMYASVAGIHRTVRAPTIDEHLRSVSRARDAAVTTNITLPGAVRPRAASAARYVGAASRKSEMVVPRSRASRRHAVDPTMHAVPGLFPRRAMLVWQTFCTCSMTLSSQTAEAEFSLSQDFRLCWCFSARPARCSQLSARPTRALRIAA